MNIKNSKELGLEIRLARKRLGVTQKDLAMAAGTGLRFIVDLEKGKQTCELEKSLTVMRSLGFVINIQSPSENTDHPE